MHTYRSEKWWVIDVMQNVTARPEDGEELVSTRRYDFFPTARAAWNDRPVIPNQRVVLRRIERDAEGKHTSKMLNTK